MPLCSMTRCHGIYSISAEPTRSGGISAKGAETWATITVPEADAFITPLIYALPVQLLAYYAAVAKGTDVDQPRNLAKSVTVE